MKHFLPRSLSALASQDDSTERPVIRERLMISAQGFQAVTLPALTSAQMPSAHLVSHNKRNQQRLSAVYMPFDVMLRMIPANKPSSCDAQETHLVPAVDVKMPFVSGVFSRILLNNMNQVNQGRVTYFSLFMQQQLETPQVVHVDIASLVANPWPFALYVHRLQRQSNFKRWLGAFTSQHEVVSLALDPLPPGKLSMTRLATQLDAPFENTSTSDELVDALKKTTSAVTGEQMFHPAITAIVAATKPFIPTRDLMFAYGQERLQQLNRLPIRPRNIQHKLNNIEQQQEVILQDNQENIMVQRKTELSVNQLMSHAKRALKGLEDALKIENKARYDHNMQELNRLLPQISAAKQTSEHTEVLGEIKKQFASLKKQGEHFKDTLAKQDDHKNSVNASKFLGFAQEMRQYFTRDRGKTSLKIEHVENAIDLQNQIDGWNETNPEKPASMFRRSQLQKMSDEVRRAAKVIRAFRSATEKAHDASEQDIAGDVLRLMAGVSVPKEMARLKNDASMQPDLAYRQRNLHREWRTATGQSSELASQEHEAMVDMLSKERDQLVLQLKAQGLSEVEAYQRADDATHQLMHRLIGAVASGKAQFVYTLLEDAHGHLRLTSVSINDFIRNATVCRNLLLDAVLNGSTANIMFGVASVDQMAALDVALQHNLLVNDASLLQQVLTLMDVTPRLLSGQVISAEDMAVIPMAMGALTQQRSMFMSDFERAHNGYDLRVDEVAPRTTDDLRRFLQNFLTTMNAAGEMAVMDAPMHTSRQRKGLLHGMPSTNRLAMPTVIGGASVPLPSPNGQATPTSPMPQPVNEPASEPKRAGIKKVKRPLEDITSQEKLRQRAEIRITTEFSKMFQLINGMEKLHDENKELRDDHKKALKILVSSLRDHLETFLHKPSDKHFVRCEVECMKAIRKAEYAFEQEPGIWRNYMMPLVNGFIKSLQIVMTFVQIPERYQPKMFKTLGKMESIWKDAGLSSRFQDILKDNDLRTDIKFVDHTQTRPK